MRSLLIFTLLFAAFALPARAQFGGSTTYAYLQLPPSARISGLGGLNISTFDSDVTFGYMNPALLNEKMDGALSVNHAFMPSGVSHGYAAYGRQLKKWNATMGGGILYRSYGDFDMTNANGDQIGKFSGSEYAAVWGISYGAEKLRYGVNAKLLYSQLESYSSFGMAADLGAVYVDTAHLMTLGLVMRNIGSQFKPYIDGNYESLPFGIDLGITKKLRHLPLAISFTLHDLQQFDIRYDDPNAVQDVNIFSTDSVSEEKNYTVDKIAQHLNIAGEFYFGKNVMARIGYDHMTRREMSIESRRGLTGFSLGFGMYIKRFRLDYGHEFYSQAGGSHHVSISVNLNEMLHK